MSAETWVMVPRRWVDEVVLALDAATKLSEKQDYRLHLGNHDRLIEEAKQWSPYARASHKGETEAPR